MLNLDIGPPLPSNEGRRVRLQHGWVHHGISIHFPRMREDQARCLKKFPLTIFQSTSLEWGKTNGGASIDVDNYISIHFPRMREDHGDPECRTVWSISIHFPRMREDTMNCEPYGQLNISIHFPRMREDCPHCGISPSICSFQSTSLEWGKTVFCYAYIPFRHISIHFPRMREDVAQAGARC